MKFSTTSSCYTNVKKLIRFLVDVLLTGILFCFQGFRTQQRARMGARRSPNHSPVASRHADQRVFSGRKQKQVRPRKLQSNAQVAARDADAEKM